MSDKNEIDDSVLGTAKIDPQKFKSRKSNPDRIASLKYAVAGLIYMFRREQSIKMLSAATLIVLVLVLLLRATPIEAAVILLSIGMIWMAEFLNSAVEAVVDLATQDIHPMAKVAKDVASAASLVGSLISLIIVILILVPKLG